MPSKLSILTPIKGYHEGFPRGAQPPLTSPSILNMRPRDRTGRVRMTVRPGLALEATVGSGPIQYIGHMSFLGLNLGMGGTSASHPGARRWNMWIVVSGGVVYYGESLGSMASAGGGLPSTGNITVGLIGQTKLPDFVSAPPLTINYTHRAAAVFAGENGTSKKLVFAFWSEFDNVALTTEYKAAAGLGNIGFSGISATRVAVWNGRVVVADSNGYWQMSRSGDDADWDFTKEDVSRAIDGSVFMSTIPNASLEPAVAMIPWSDRTLLYCTDRRVWRFSGDPGDNGTITLANPECAVLGPNAWTGDERGGLWIATAGGLMRFNGAAFEPVAQDNAPSFFDGLDRSTFYVHLMWERAERSLHVLRAPIDGSAGTHLFFDADQEAFWPYRYPAACGPSASYVYDGAAASDRAYYVGAHDGRILRISESATSDPGPTAIDAYAFLGPIKPFGDETEAILLSCRFVLGEVPSGMTQADNWRMDYTLQCGDDEYDALSNPALTRTGSYVGSAGPPATAYTGKLPAFGVRTAGAAHFVKVHVNAVERLFVFERAQLEFEEGRAA